MCAKPTQKLHDDTVAVISHFLRKGDFDIAIDYVVRYYQVFSEATFTNADKELFRTARNAHRDDVFAEGAAWRWNAFGYESAMKAHAKDCNRFDAALAARPEVFSENKNTTPSLAGSAKSVADGSKSVSETLVKAETKVKSAATSSQPSMMSELSAVLAKRNQRNTATNTTHASQVNNTGASDGTNSSSRDDGHRPPPALMTKPAVDPAKQMALALKRAAIAEQKKGEEQQQHQNQFFARQQLMKAQREESHRKAEEAKRQEDERRHEEEMQRQMEEEHRRAQEQQKAKKQEVRHVRRLARA